MEVAGPLGTPLGFEGNPVGEGTTRRGTDTPVHRPQRPAAGRDWGQEEKGMTEDEMVGWHH